MATSTLRPRQIQELDLTLERERRWLVEHIGALEALRGGGADVGAAAETAPSTMAGDAAAPAPGEEARSADVPALHALVDALTKFLATELAPDDTRELLDRAYHQRLDEVDDALTRIAEGLYGVCEECDGAIYPPRLKRVPWTRYCRHCAERLAKEGIHRVIAPSTAAATDATLEYELIKALLT
ncbi:MAG TPA: TraR/DksA C4-type zinc finger protein [Chloroflexota bacterium]|nr:TraR/DksA C4-type zinc finger protein [Chloroflexota bacterium]